MEQFKSYLFRYDYDGRSWCISIKAASEEEAEARMQQMPYAESLGETIAVIPAKLGIMAKLMCWWHNHRLR